MAKYVYVWDGEHNGNQVSAFGSLDAIQITGSPPPAGKTVVKATVKIRMLVYERGIDSTITFLATNGSNYLYADGSLAPVSVEQDPYWPDYLKTLTYETEAKSSGCSLTEWFSGQTVLKLDHIGTGNIVGGVADILFVEIIAETASVSNAKYYDGANWIPCVIKMWDGTKWADQTAKYYDGANWK